MGVLSVGKRPLPSDKSKVNLHLRIRPDLKQFAKVKNINLSQLLESVLVRLQRNFRKN